MRDVWVVKLGGSLIGSVNLQRWLEAIVGGCGTGGPRAVIVPGGGPFADTVREVQCRARCSDRIAHLAAIKAMEQTALLMWDLMPAIRPAADFDQILRLWQAGAVPIWMPFDRLADDTSLASSWDISSDSLAAWLALALEADNLLLVKSLATLNDVVSAYDMSASGIVDAGFPRMINGARFRAWLGLAGGHARFREALGSGGPAGLPIKIDGTAVNPAPTVHTETT